MNHRTHMFPQSEHAIKAVGGALFSAASWGGGHIAQAVEQAPAWLKELDTPLIVAGLSYAVIHLWKEWRTERNARIADRDAFIERLSKEAEKGETSRASLLTATNTQTGVMQDLVRELRNAGLHKPKQGEE